MPSCVYLSSLLLVLLALHESFAANITVSGISSGGAFALQFHVAHSSMVSGAGIVAGAPYYCSGGTVAGALTCMQDPQAIILATLYTATTYAYTTRTIDSPSHLASSKVYLYSGTGDTVVNPGTMVKVQNYYQNYIPSSSIKSVFNIQSEHAFITNSYGNKCTYLGLPYINNCAYDQAGDILTYLYGSLKQAVAPVAANIQQLGQVKFIPVVSADVAALADTAYLYVPSKCVKGSGCKVHVAFHGCLQTLADINTTFVTQAGYNGWAEANNLVILYPQAKKTAVNPNGCWDWWGYTGADYACQLGVQIATVKNMIDYVTSSY